MRYYYTFIAGQGPCRRAGLPTWSLAVQYLSRMTARRHPRPKGPGVMAGECDQAAVCPEADASKNEVRLLKRDIAHQVNLDLGRVVTVDVAPNYRLIESAIIEPIDAVRLNNV